MKKKTVTKFLAGFLSVLMVMVLSSVAVFAEDATEVEAVAEAGVNLSVGASFGTNGYYTILTSKEWDLVPGAAIEREIVINNSTNDRRQVMHVIEVDPSNPDVSIVPGYYQIDKDLTKEENWSHKELTEMAKYYENNLGYNIVGGMNTDLYYNSYSPRVLVYNGESIGNFGKNVATGGTVLNPTSSILYVFKDAEGKVSCDVRAFNKTEFDSYLADGTLLHAVGVSFGMTVKDGELVTKTEERTSAPAARSMVGIKEDGTLVICMNDGRTANNSVGFCTYELGESMLALGCKWAANCDGGGSSTFISKRVGEDDFTMRSVPCDGAQRPTAHGIFVTSNVAPTGILESVTIKSDYDYFAPGTAHTFVAEAIDTHGYTMDMPADATWSLSDASFGTVSEGKLVLGQKTGTVSVQVSSDGKVVGEREIIVADPEIFNLSAESTVMPYSTSEKVRTISLPIVATMGSDKDFVPVYVDTNAVSVKLSDAKAGTLDGFKFTATSDTSVTGVDVTVSYGDTTHVYAITFGKGSEVIYDFENGNKAGFMGFEEASKWSKDNGVNNTLVGSNPLDGQFNPYLSSNTFMATVENGGQVRNGNYSLAWKLDNTDASFANWSYNVLFNTGDSVVLRDVENGQLATAIGMWVYIPVGAPGLSFQSQFYTKNADGTYTHAQAHFMFTSAATGKQTNLNSATEADIPESRWVYMSINISSYNYLCTSVATDESSLRSPSFLRTYVKPTAPAELTFYIDDITLDYSSAVDDRVLPTITAPTYSTSDTAVSLENGAVISGSNFAFSATVADNAALDLTSGKIFVDGVAVKSTVAGNALSSAEDIVLSAGAHTVVFEIKDELGNPAKLSRTFTVSGDAAISLSGHNDSGETPKAQSIYYVDVNVADISEIEELVFGLKLNNANTWETKGAVTANGFEAEFSYNEVSEILTVRVYVTDASQIATDETVLVSIPVRVWTFDRYNYVTGTYYNVADMGNKPVVNINCEAVYGFGGSISVATELTTISSPYHTHDAELTVMNKEASLTEAGYENRTYCETCKSVVDWGTIIPKIVITHNYEIVDGKFVCSDEDCGHVYEAGTGIFEMNGNLYYSINNVLQQGWQTADDGYCYSSSDYVLKTGKATINKNVYTFNEDGILVKGAWIVTSAGTKYSYGPSTYKRTWAEIDGADYYFGRDGYMYTGIRYIKHNPDTDPVWHDFGETGATDRNVLYAYTGLIEYNNELYYMIDGVGQMGLFCIDGDYYYFQFGEGFEHVYYAAMDKSVYVKTTNGVTFPDGTPVPQKTFYFDSEGKMYVSNGIVDGVYYENGQAVSYKGLVYQDGAYYYINYGGKIVAGKSAYVKTTNGLTFSDGTPIPNKTFEFDEEGKMIILNGIVDGIYYENSIPISYKGLVKQDGAYYYINYGGKIVVGKSAYVKTTNGLTFSDGTPIPNKTFEFDEEGKMIILNGIVDGIYYENSVPVSYKGLVYQDGAYYYINYGGKIVVGKSAYVKTTNGLIFPDGTPVPNKTFEFDEEGKMIY
ncbi:MAG: phosphodiester glycosidase family protein [Clostridia bacterium]|nr:phosphodiester glycosidase family protein [Clostridia bacterium]